MSYDVSNLYGSVPSEEAAAIVLKLLEEDSTLSTRTTLSFQSLRELILFCIKSNYFKCNGKLYRTTTCPIGSPLSAVLASVFMKSFEERALATSPVPVRYWRRYVDDTAVIVRKGDEEVLLSHLNSVHTCIKFTCEKETEGRIPFLDILIRRQEDGALKLSVYRKPTTTDRLLDFSSAHGEHVKWGVVKCLRKRAEDICGSEEDLMDEKRLLYRTFVKNGYPKPKLRRYLFGKRPQLSKDEKRTSLWIPFVPGLSEKIAGLGRSLNLEIRYLRGKSLKHVLSRTKLDGVDEMDKAGVVYMQKCLDCPQVYVGETGRRAVERKKEHEADVRLMRMRSAISEHVHTLNHRPDFDSFQILESEKNLRRRRVKESLHILKNDTFNRDGGVGVDRCWRSILN